MRRLIIVFKWSIAKFVWYPITIFESQLLGLLLLMVMIFRPNGLIPEKLLRIAGINYRNLVRETTPVDWRVIRRVEEKGGLLRGLRRGKE